MKNLRSIGFHLRQAKQFLAPVSESASLDAEILLAFALNKNRSYLYAWPEKNLTLQEQKRFAYYLECRQYKKPIALITGKKEFWSLELLVSEDTLIPRPETELMIECVLNKFKSTDKIHLADLGTGSGAMGIALAYERPLWQIYATDISEKSLAIAQKNAHHLQLQNISFYQGSWYTALPNIPLNAIISNPPYLSVDEWNTHKESLSFEPYSALVAGMTGKECLNAIIAGAKAHLAPGGYVIVEHGYLQGPAVRSLFRTLNYREACTIKDLAGKERITLGACFLS